LLYLRIFYKILFILAITQFGTFIRPK